MNTLISLGSRRRLATVIVPGIVTTAVVAMVVLSAKSLDLRFYLNELSPSTVAHAYWRALDIGLVAPLSFIGLLFVLTLERWFPARPNQRIFSTGFWQDVTWFVCNLIFLVSIVRLLNTFLNRTFAGRLDFIASKFDRYPTAVLVIVAILVADFLEWYAHLVHHKVQPLWKLHSIHHSQRELNLFTNERTHFVEHLTDKLLQFVPLFLLYPDVQFATWYVILRVWHARLTHANIRSNFGPLRYIFVTPQSHQVHHSIEREHWDRNYGGLLSIWDYLFRTQYRGYDDYPATGVPDAVPLEENRHPFRLLRTLGAQYAYPVRHLGTSSLLRRRAT